MNVCMPKSDSLEAIYRCCGRRRVEKELLRVSDIRVAMGKGAPVALPKIWIVPAGWHVPGKGVIAGGVGTHNLGGIREVFVELPLSLPLLEHRDDPIRRLLSHEVLHAAWWYLQLIAGNGEHPQWTPSEIVNGPIDARIDYATRTDTTRLADPRDWLGAEDADVVSDDNSFMVPYGQRYGRCWLRRGLPTESPPLEWDHSGVFHVHKTILEKAKEILAKEVSNVPK